MELVRPTATLSVKSVILQNIGISAYSYLKALEYKTICHFDIYVLCCLKEKERCFLVVAQKAMIFIT